MARSVRSGLPVLRNPTERGVREIGREERAMSESSYDQPTGYGQPTGYDQTGRLRPNHRVVRLDRLRRDHDDRRWQPQPPLRCHRRRQRRLGRLGELLATSTSTCRNGVGFTSSWVASWCSAASGCSAATSSLVRWAVLVASLSLIANFFFIPVYPLWALYGDRHRRPRDMGGHCTRTRDAGGVGAETPRQTMWAVGASDRPSLPSPELRV